MAFDQHRGATAPGPLQSEEDPQQRGLSEFLQQLAAQVRSRFQFSEDPFSTGALESVAFDTDNPLSVGRIVQAVAGTYWYKVQLDRRQTPIGACALSHAGTQPIGIRESSVYPVNSNVLTYLIPGVDFAVILGVLPDEVLDNGLYMPDWVSQDGVTGLRREAAHRELMRICALEGGVKDFSAGRPVDATSFDWGVTAPETGIGVHVDPFQVYLRVNEVCGLFANFFDSYLKLAMWNGDVESAAHVDSVREDEGELQRFLGDAIYPWEALGALAADQPISELRDDAAIQYRLPHGKLDLTDAASDLQPFYRVQDYRGYLGQGGHRFVCAPPSAQTLFRYRDTEAVPGLFEEAIGLDGSYGLRSAHSLHLVKYPLIPVPRRQKLAEDPTSTDVKADEGAYRFSGLEGNGNGPEHLVGNMDTSEESKNLVTAAGVLDLIAYHFNWKGLHPFQYHRGDFVTPEEGDLSPLTQGAAPINFSALSSQWQLDAANPMPLQIDHRYGEVDYYPSISNISMLPDGGIVIGDGYGAEIRMTGGKITFSCPGDIEFLPGRGLHLFTGGDAIIRAKGSVDITTSDNDVRIKAEKNLHMLAGNSGTGGLLLESKSIGDNYEYKNKIGEDVVSSGIMLRSAQSPIAALGQQVYLRTGGETLGDGNIVLDAGQGRQSIVEYSYSKLSFVGQSSVIYFGASRENGSSISKTILFSASHTLIDTPLSVGGTTSIVKGSGLFVEGSCVLDRGGSFQTQSGGAVGKMTQDTRQRLREALSEIKTSMRTNTTGGRSYFQTMLAEPFYAENKLGNAELHTQATFSLRDATDDSQYKTSEYEMAEPRWQQLARLQGQTPGEIWTETPVTYQSADQYPYPGKNAFEGEGFCRLKSLKLFDIQAGRSKPRTDSAYEAHQLDEWERLPLNENFRVIG